MYWNWKGLREASKITLSNAAAFLGVTVEQLQRWEDGEEPPEEIAKEMLQLYSPKKQTIYTPIEDQNPAYRPAKKPITCSKCGSTNLAYVSEAHRAIWWRFFAIIALALAASNIIGSIISMMDNPNEDARAAFFVGLIFLIVYICMQLKIFFDEARSHVKCVCKDCGNVWLHD